MIRHVNSDSEDSAHGDNFDYFQEGMRRKRIVRNEIKIIETPIVGIK